MLALYSIETTFKGVSLLQEAYTNGYFVKSLTSIGKPIVFHLRKGTLVYIIPYIYSTLWVLLMMQMDVKSMVLGHILTRRYNLNLEGSLLPNVAPKWTSTSLIEIFIP